MLTPNGELMYRRARALLEEAAQLETAAAQLARVYEDLVAHLRAVGFLDRNHGRDHVWTFTYTLGVAAHFAHTRLSANTYLLLQNGVWLCNYALLLRSSELWPSRVVYAPNKDVSLPYALLDDLRHYDVRTPPLRVEKRPLLAAFCGSAQRVLSRDQLMSLSRLHSAEVYDRTVDVQIVRLRRKIEADPARPQLIVTERGAGYIFVPPVESLY